MSTFYCFIFIFTKNMDDEGRLKNSVADPDPVFLGHSDPDPGKYRIRIRILYPQKDPVAVILICSLYKIV